MKALVDAYRPGSLDTVYGQSWIVHQLKLWLETPHAGAFVFAGGTGTGKTSTAIALAIELGVAIDEAEFGGLHQITSGEQTGDSVRQAMKSIAHRPFSGSGWRVLIVNEADAMTAGAAYTWLDALENLPAQALVIFTTNALHKLPQRLRDRCEIMEFASSALFLKPELQDFARLVWLKETGRSDCPDIEDFGPIQDADGNASFRRLLQQMEPFVRSARAGLAIAPRRQTSPVIQPNQPDRGAAARKAWATRRARLKQGA
jgi:replication-associated recombination protein RarA